MTSLTTDLTIDLTADLTAVRSTEQRLFALVESALALPARSVLADTPIASLGDSLDWLELLMAVEEAFGVEFDPAQTKSIGTVADLMRLLPREAAEVPTGDLRQSVQQALGTMAAPRPA